jgi:hypothetical protein
MIRSGGDRENAMMRSIAMVAALGVLFAALPLEAQTPRRDASPVYAGMKGKPAKQRSNAQRSAQKKATKAAAAKMKRSGPSMKQKAAQKKATKAAAAKAKAKPNKRRA